MTFQLQCLVTVPWSGTGQGGFFEITKRFKKTHEITKRDSGNLSEFAP